MATLGYEIQFPGLFHSWNVSIGIAIIAIIDVAMRIPRIVIPTIPILLFPLENATFVAIAWGMLLLILLNFYIAKTKKENPVKLIAEHILLATFVIIVSYVVGDLVAAGFS